MKPSTRQVLTTILAALVAVGVALGIYTPAPCPECPVCAPSVAVDPSAPVPPAPPLPVTESAPEAIHVAAPATP